ncbi:glycoside hydrolase family 25 protein [Wolbachia endosymbiont of Pentidionis agamae]|uniref:glycoside hydrolase family 25 protein n=1 Tax=Wolbachia endosymbiont of Pentidionis agamae TaxID=3110435 RepID=UPI002FCEF7A9
MIQQSGNSFKKGVAVSHWDGDISWKDVANAGAGFAFAKSTEGETFQDEKFVYNFSNIKENNIEAGAFHVFRMTSTPKKQHDNIINVLKKAKFDIKRDKLFISATIGLCDAEHKTECDDPTKHTNKERADNLDSLLTMLKNEDYNVIIHTSPKPWDQYYASTAHDFSKYPLFVAHWHVLKPMIPQDWQKAGKSYDYWNYTDKGTISGIQKHGTVCLCETHR